MRNSIAPVRPSPCRSELPWRGRARRARPPATRANLPSSRPSQKTRDSIVTIKVEKQGNWGRKDVVGTGVIVDERGYVVTNRHVVAGADRVTVELADGTEVAASVVTEDASHDLAILRVSADQARCQALTFGPGSDLMVGETVIAVGHPFGYTQHGVHRHHQRPGPRDHHARAASVLTDLIQTNASINPGNSGGPLLNINGELIGINVALREGAQGIAFALNADTVQEVLSKHLSAGKVAHVGHGLACREAVPDEGERPPAGGRRGRGRAQPGGRGRPQERRRARQASASASVTNRFDVERALWSYKAGRRGGSDRGPRRQGDGGRAMTLSRSGDPTNAVSRCDKQRVGEAAIGMPNRSAIVERERGAGTLRAR